jgi:hypothetical protein
MALTTGTVSCLNLADGFGFVEIRTSPTSAEAFILWFGATRSPGPIALWIPQLQLALARGLTVIISHGTSSAFIDSVRINAP